MHRPWRSSAVRRGLLGGAILIVAVGAAACGGSDDEAATSSAVAAATEVAASSAAPAASSDPATSAEAGSSVDAAASAPAETAATSDTGASSAAALGECAKNAGLAISFPNSSKIGAVQTTLDEAKKQLEAAGWKVQVDDPGTDLNKQVSTIKTWIEQKVPVIMSVTLNPPVFEDLAKQARAAGIKWITYGSSLQNEDAMVGFRQYEDGVPLGEAAGQWLTDNFGGNGKVIILGYEQGDWGRRRAQGLIDGLKKTAPNAEIVAQQDAISPTEGLNTTRTLLQAHPDVNVILGVEDPATEGAYQAWIGSGRDKGDPQLFIGGMDGTPDALKLLSAGDTVYRGSMAIPLIKLGDAIAETSQLLVCGQDAPDAVIPLELVTPGSPLAEQYLKDQGAG